MSEAAREIEDYGTPTKTVVIPYTPRPHFERLHEIKKRWIFLVAHRRAGKSVFAINHMIRAALQNPRKDPPPRYAYVGPSFDQTKDLIWGYLKHFTGPIPGMRFSEGELRATFPNGAQINLYGGAKAYERMRGLYFDGAMLDEFPLLNPAVFSRVVRPCLADYQGWCIVSGTSNGDDHFADLKRKIAKNERWEVVDIPVTETDCLDPDEIEEMCADMSPEEYAQEMLCSFETPVQGAYYAKWINDIYNTNRLTSVPYDPHSLVYTGWDLGVDDETAIWFIQRVGREFHAIDFYQNSGEGFKHYRDVCEEKGYSYGGHLFPHDARAKEISTGTSREEVLIELFGADMVTVVPMSKVEDGITAVRGLLPVMWFDQAKTLEGFTALKNYQKTAAGRPKHDWASHPADALRTFATGFQAVVGWGGSNVIPIRGPLKRRRKRAI